MTGFNHQVAWREFQRVAERPRRKSEDAYVKAGFFVDCDWEEVARRNWRVTAVRGRVSVNQADSWVVQGKNTDALLGHEQGHYDITALGMREAANRVSSITGRSGEHIERQRDRIIRQIQRTINEANERYDTQTEHSRNGAAQRRWLRSIRAAKDSENGTIEDLPE